MPKTKKPTVYDIERQQHDNPIDIKISTKVPNKWRFCDLETQQVYKWDEARNDFIISELPSVFPNFGDKGNIMNKAREFTIDVENALAQYNRCFDYDHSKPVDIVELGQDVVKALDKMRTSLILWKIELDSWYRGMMVEKIINEHEKNK
jgi:hypothetical protein